MPNIAVFIEQREGEIKKVAWQMISEARRITDVAGGEVWGVLLVPEAAGGGTDERLTVEAATQAGAHGARRLCAAKSEHFRVYNSEAYATALAAFAKARQPDLILIGSTAMGKDLSPKLATKLACACLSDCVGIKWDGGAFEIRRPIFAGKCYIDATPRTKPAVVGVRPNAFALSAGGGATATHELFSPGLDSLDLKARVVEVQKTAGKKIELTEAEVIVSGGRGIKGPENYRLIEELAATLGAAAGASRAVVDAGWVPHSHQVGQTGKTVSPKLYVACGISGAIQHLAGMSSSKCIVAINKDPNAPIFKVADYGIVGDLFQIVPALQKEIEKLKT